MVFKKIELSLAVLMFFVLTSSSNAQNRLEPFTQSIFDIPNDCEGYYPTLKKLLFENIHPEYSPYARYIVTPAFHAEYVLTFDFYDTPKYHLTLTKPSRKISFLMDDKNAKIEIIKIQKEIDSSDMKMIIALIDKSINKSKISNHVGNDGTNYFFSNTTRTAMIWSPKRDTKTYYLIELMDDIIKLVESEEKAIKFSPELVKRIKKLSR